MDNPNEGYLPLGMLPVRTVDNPKITTLSDRTIYEFPIIGAVALADPRSWTPIKLQRAGQVLRILKPICFATQVQAKGEISDQFLDVRYSVFRIEMDLYPELATPQPLEVYQAIHELVYLFRTIARQYWIGFAMANEGSLVQGLRSRIESGIAVFSGQGSFITPFIVYPIDEPSWQFLGALLASGTFPSTAEVMLCDALLEVRRGDILQAILLLGVACEVAVMAFLEDLISQKNLSKTKQDEILSKSFSKKLLEETVNLGANSPAASVIPRFPADWALTVCELYRLRNQTVHGGRCMVEDNGMKRPIELRDIPKYIFSAEALLAWITRQRNRLGIPGAVTATMLPMGYPISGIITPNS